MNEIKNSNTTANVISSSAPNGFEHSPLNLNVYKELDENPNQNLDLVSHIKNQLRQLDSIHKRKMFLIKELATTRSR